jgi:hypothetical protein
MFNPSFTFVKKPEKQQQKTPHQTKPTEIPPNKKSSPSRTCN